MVKILDAGLEFSNTLVPLNNKAVRGFILHHMAHPSWDVKQVHNYHRNSKKWLGIGYNYFIDLEGDVYKGRGKHVGAHTGGYNSTYIGIGFQGDFERGSQRPTDAQYDAAINLIKELQKEFKNANQIDGHNDFGNTACPGKRFDVNRVRALKVSAPVVNQPTQASQSTNTTFSNLSSADKYKEIANATNVYHLQNLLMGAGERLPRWGADGKPGAETLSAIQAFQSRHKISSPTGDNFGRPGPATMRKLREIVAYQGTRRADRSGYPKGTDVRAVQLALGGLTADSVYGPKTAAAVLKYQRDNKLVADSILGPQTWSHLFG